MVRTKCILHKHTKINLSAKYVFIRTACELKWPCIRHLRCGSNWTAPEHAVHRGSSAPRELEQCDMNKYTFCVRMQVPFKASTWDVTSQTFTPSCTPSEYKERSRRATAAALSQLETEIRLKNHTRISCVYAALFIFIVALALCFRVVASGVYGNNGQPTFPVELPQVGLPSP
jgi:hypothetical protein